MVATSSRQPLRGCGTGVGGRRGVVMGNPQQCLSASVVARAAFLWIWDENVPLCAPGWWVQQRGAQSQACGARQGCVPVGLALQEPPAPGRGAMDPVGGAGPALQQGSGSCHRGWSISCRPEGKGGGCATRRRQIRAAGCCCCSQRVSWQWRRWPWSRCS